MGAPSARLTRAHPPRPSPRALNALVADIRACRLCRDTPQGAPLPHEPRPVLRVSTTARIGVFGQAPGTRVHASGTPFTDPSGVRLRQWMGVTDDEFYDVARIAIIPMGFCFPGLDTKGGDLPPRRECAPQWRARLMTALPNLELMLLVGQYAQRWREIVARPVGPVMVPLPHPSWRNNAWIKERPGFDAELLPWLRNAVRAHL